MEIPASEPSRPDDPAASAIRPGEERFAADPGTADDARLAFIGRIVSPWTHRADCPKNMREARARERPAVVEIDAAFRPALTGLERRQWLHVLTWLGYARRDLALQMPRHAKGATGTFALRSPVRPNPIGMHLVQIVSMDFDAGRIVIDGIDVVDGTAVLDLKPFFATVDVPPDASATAPAAPAPKPARGRDAPVGAADEPTGPA